MIALIEMKIEVPSAIGANHEAGEHVALDVLRFALSDLPTLFLHLLPSSAVDDRLVDLPKHRHVLRIIVDALLVLVRLAVRLEINQVAAVFLHGQYFDDGRAAPCRTIVWNRLACTVNPFTRPVCHWYQHFFCSQQRCNLIGSKSIHRQGVDTPNSSRRFFIHDPAFRIVRILHVAIRWLA